MIRLGRKRQRRSMPGIAYLDLLVNLLMVFVVLVALTLALVKPHAGKPAIETLGTVAVVMTWPEKDNSDVDLWMQSPKGSIAFFGSPSVDYMYLEHDDLAYFPVKGQKQHYERMIIQQAITGEYIVNAMLYRKGDSLASKDVNIPVTVQLWRLRGNDQVISTVHFTITTQGSEHTAFRFSLNDANVIFHVNHLSKKMLGHQYDNSAPPTPGSSVYVPPGSSGP